MKKSLTIILLLITFTLLAAPEGNFFKRIRQKVTRYQTICPVSYAGINKKLYVDYNGYRIYACNEECLKKIKDDPAEYLKKISEIGETAYNTPVCPKCGAVKGTPECCNPKAPKCPECGKIKGSPGCCK